MLYLLAIIQILFICFIIIPYSIYILAKKDFFFTLVEERTAKAVFRFNKLYKILTSYNGHIQNSKGYLVPEEDSIKKIFRQRFKKISGGLHWIGIPGINKIYKYEREELSYSQVANEKGEIVPKIKTEPKKYDFVSLKDTLYYAIIQNAETSDMVPVNLYFQLTFRIVNVQKALFEVEDWVEMALNQFKPVLRDWIATKKIEELIGAPGEGETKSENKIGEEAKKLINEKTDIDERLFDKYGIKLDENGYGIALIDPSGKRGEKYMEELTKKWAATKEAERMKIVYDELRDSGGVGQFARLLEALEKASENPSKMIIFPLGGIEDMIKQWTGFTK